MSTSEVIAFKVPSMSNSGVAPIHIWSEATPQACGATPKFDIINYVLIYYVLDFYRGYFRLLG